MNLDSKQTDPNCFASKNDTLIYRIQVSKEYGITVWVKMAEDTKWTKIAYFEFGIEYDGVDLTKWFSDPESMGFGLIVGNDCKADIDYVAVWTGLGEMPEDHSTSDYEALVG